MNWGEAFQQRDSNIKTVKIKNTITEIKKKNTLERSISRLEEVEDRITDLEDKAAENS